MNKLLSDYLQGKISKDIPTCGQTQGILNLHLDDDEELIESNDEDEVEAKQYVQKQMDYYSSQREQTRGGLMDIVDGDDETVIESEFLNELSLPAVFGKYPFDVYCKRPLPIDSFREKILDLINTNQVLIVQGPTGCGKTTQVPQYIVDECKEKNLPCNIVVTQPRRIAAINIANRVCEERGWALETVCGYQVGLEKRVSEDVILTYVTTEVLLQKLISERNLNKYTHVIIDEVHERNKTLDFLLLIVRKYLFTNSQKVKVILMSATMEAEQFAYYFRSLPRNLKSDYIPAPILKVNKRSEFTNTICYIEKIELGTKEIPRFDITEPRIDPIQQQKCLALLNFFDKLDDVDPITQEINVGSVLIFLPGFHEIEEMHNLLNNEGRKSKSKYLWEVIPLHSSLPTEQMRLAFKKPSEGYRKIILSTNIAESSVTVADVNYVIDFCLTKQVSVNQMSKFSTLSLEWASHNNCDQRAGRVGRVANGRVYRLVTTKFYKHEMSANSIPEMQRAPLENIILYLKLLDIHDTPKNVLQLAISPPNLKDVESCVWHLKEVGALLPTCRGHENINDGDLTFMGRVMGSLPIDVHLAKLIILGQMFSCLRDTVVMAAGATVTNLFNRPYDQRLECYRKKLALADHSCSDFFSILNLYNVWFQKKTEGSFKNDKDEYAWCRTYFVSYKSIKEMKILIDEIEKRLKHFRIEQVGGPAAVFLTAVERPTVLKVAICGAFYPNYFVRSSEYGQIDTREAFKTLNGRDPYNTIYLGNMTPNQPCQIYVRQIKKIMDAGSNVHVSFDGDSSKIFLEYKSTKQPEPVVVDGRQCVSVEYGRIAEDVYVALRKRQLRMRFKLNVLPEIQAWKFAEETEKHNKSLMGEEVNCFSQVATTVLPSLDIEYISIIMTHIVDAGFFYCQNDNEETRYHVQRLFQLLNGPTVFLQFAKGELELDGKLYAARFASDNKFYRCKVVHVYPDTKGMIQVMFVDYGNTQQLRRNQLFDLPPVDDPALHCPPLAMCCALSEVKPSNVEDAPTGLWSPRATQILIDRTKGVVLHAKVYSVVSEVVHLELYSSNPSGSSQRNSSFNQWLIKNHLAEPAQESFMSKADHLLRDEVQRSENPVNTAAQITSVKLCRYKDFEAPKMTDYDYTEVELTGPFSPLEMKVCGLVAATSQVAIRIDEDSVNGVLLDEFPEDSHGRLMVAGFVAQSATSNTLKIGQTTMMPNIPGLPTLMTLLFCPAMEPKMTTDGTRVGGMLCGLGYNKETGRANYPNHDIAMILDTELSIENIRDINVMKSSMNRAIKMMNNVYDEVNYLEELLDVQKCIKKQLFELLYKRPKDVKSKGAVRNLTKWDSFDHNVEILKMKEGTYGEDDIFKMLWFVRIPDERQKQMIMNESLDDLFKIAKGLEPARPIVCALCQSHILHNADSVRTHLFSDGHKQKFTEYKEQNPVP